VPTDRESQAGGGKSERNIPRELLASVTIWITRGEGTVCDACGKTIAAGEPQFQIVANNGEMRFDRDCFLRRLKDWRTNSVQSDYF